MNAAIISALLAAALAFTGAWKIQSWRMDANEKHHVEQAAQQQRELSRMEQKRSSGVISAQNDARKREVGLRADADAAQSELGGLRAQSDAALSRASASHAACLVTAAAATAVLNQCAADFTGLAEVADRHVSDIQTITDAWPK